MTALAAAVAFAGSTLLTFVMSQGRDGGTDEPRPPQGVVSGSAGPEAGAGTLARPGAAGAGEDRTG